MGSHIKALGILHLILAGISVIGGLLMLLLFGGLAAFVGIAAGGAGGGIASTVLGLIGTAFCLFAILMGLPGIIVGAGLLARQSWARVAGIILSALLLLHFPFGAILGLYGLWVLLQDESSQVLTA
jgi:hypothetical protein